MSALLQIDGLNKSFGGVAATVDVSLNVKQGEIHAIIGPNGAGKTTLISQLSGLLAPDSGAVHFRGKPITNLPAYKRAHLGMGRSFQTTSLLMGMSAADNVAIAAQAQEGHSFKFIRPAASIQFLRDKAQAALDRVGLGARANDMASSLSHGERRQLEICLLYTSPSPRDS